MAADKKIMDLLSMSDFDAVGYCSARALRPKEEVRQYCKDNSCQKWGSGWGCPPYCGELSDFEDLFENCDDCYVFQTTIPMSSGYDNDRALKGMREHCKKIRAMQPKLKELYPDARVFASGPCTYCETCAYPDPCSHPDMKIVSMEAAGLMVKEVADAAGLDYIVKPLASDRCIFTSIVVL